MAQTSGFFNAEELSDGTYDREYFAQQFAYYFAMFIGNGVFMTDSEKLQVYQDASLGMMVNLNIGNAFINGYWYDNSSILSLPIENASSVYSRIDSVRLRWDTTERTIVAVVVKGENSDNPQPPALQRDASVFELELARISIARAQVGISNANIEDMRLNSDVCGIVHGVVDQVDLTTIYQQFAQWYLEFTTNSEDTYVEWTEERQQQFDTWFANINAKLGDEPATNLQLQIDALKNDQVITIPVFSQSAAPYSVDIDVANLKATDAIELFVATIPDDAGKSTADIATALKTRTKYLAMVQAECTTDGKLHVTSYAKKPAEAFQVWLRGCSTQ